MLQGKKSIIYILTGIGLFLMACGPYENQKGTMMKERQISFSSKNHSLDNNDNFSPDDRYLCYDTRGTVFNDNLANSKSIEKIEIATGRETVLWEPESITGEEAAPGVAAVSWHPSAGKVIFIHGPLPEEVVERGYYGIRNRTGVEVSAEGKGNITKVDCRDVATDRPTTPGAHRGGTHRHEYSRNGKRIGFTYDDHLLPHFDRTIGYMEPHDSAPEGYSHFFTVLLKPAEQGKSKAGEIEKAFGDSWVSRNGTMRAFIGKVRAENGKDFYHDLFVADIPESVDVSTASAGDSNNFPEPPQGIKIRRLTNGMNVSGIVRGSDDGSKISFLAEDEQGINQIFIIDSKTQLAGNGNNKDLKQVSRFSSDAAFLRWHPGGEWIFSVTDGNIAATYAGESVKQGTTVMLTNDDKQRTELVVSNNGNTLAYNIKVRDEENNKHFSQIFMLEPDFKMMTTKVKY